MADGPGEVAWDVLRAEYAELVQRIETLEKPAQVPPGTPPRNGFFAEYCELAQLEREKGLTLIPLTPLNMKFNRYQDIMPIAETTVKLLHDGQPGASDFINANYLKGFWNAGGYIAAQGPLPTTVGDFWKMVWQQECPGVVMVTNLIEKGMDKCHMYWPGDSTATVRVDNLSVEYVDSKSPSPDLVIRTFKLSDSTTGENRLIPHVHFVGWPDQGVPPPETLMSFISTVDREVDLGTGQHPLAVHCSAGIGRTGVFICLHVILHTIELFLRTGMLAGDKLLDIKGTVLKMREQRASMVQTNEQYTFLYYFVKQSVGNMLAAHDAQRR